jgi:hypothetical protein
MRTSKAIFTTLGENSLKCELKLVHDTGIKNDLVHVWDVNVDLPQKLYPKPTTVVVKAVVSSPVSPSAATRHVSQIYCHCL